MTAWYEESFGREYLDLYAHRDADEARADIQAIVRLISPPRDLPLLDLCCGACRHTLVLRELGYQQIVGVDLSKELLDAGAEALSDACSGTLSESGVRLVCSDMRSIPYREHFATVLSLFTSFGYFGQDSENGRVLDAVYQALLPGGQFLLDTMSRDHVIAHLVPEDERVLPGRRVHNVRRLTAGKRRVEKTTRVVTDEGQSRTFYESVRLYSEIELRAMLSRSGFFDIQSFGTLEGEPFVTHSERLIMVAKKGDA